MLLMGCAGGFSVSEVTYETDPTDSDWQAGLQKTYRHLRNSLGVTPAKRLKATRKANSF